MQINLGDLDQGLNRDLGGHFLEGGFRSEGFFSFFASFQPAKKLTDFLGSRGDYVA
jgi:hypothetical protein